MRIAVIFYSFTGNNKALATAVAKELSADLIEISEGRARKMGTIAMDMLLNLTPRVQPAPSELEKYDHILFVAPVWMSKAATPLRAYLKHLKKHPQSFGFISISGGALNDNPELADDLEKRAGTRPAVLVDLHIADLLPPGPKPTTQDTSTYHLNDAETAKLASIAVASVRSAIGL